MYRFGYRVVGLVVLAGVTASGAWAQGGLGAWQTGAPMPTARQEMPHVALDGKVYVPAGINAGRRGVDVVEVYDPATDTWATVAPLPIRMHHLAAAAVDGRLYVLGGYVGDSFSPTDRVFAYDPATDTWTEGAPMPTPRGAHAAVAYGGKIYVFGGEQFTVPQAVTEVYDPATDTWATAAPMPTAREHLAAAPAGSMLYVVGGRVNGGFLNLQNLATLEAYDPATDAWTERAPMPTRRGGLAAAGADGRLYVFGGETFEDGGSAVFPQNEAYDPVTNTWRAAAAMPLPRHGLGAATVAGAIYLIGGGPVAGFSTTAVNSRFLPPAAGPTAAEGAAPPVAFALHANAPNPLAARTTIRFTLPAAGPVHLAVYDLLGRAVATLHDGPLPPGPHAAAWDAADHPAGVYLYRLTAGPRTAVRTMVVVR